MRHSRLLYIYTHILITPPTLNIPLLAIAYNQYFFAQLGFRLIDHHQAYLDQSERPPRSVLPAVSASVAVVEDNSIFRWPIATSKTEGTAEKASNDDGTSENGNCNKEGQEPEGAVAALSDGSEEREGLNGAPLSVYTTATAEQQHVTQDDDEAAEAAAVTVDGVQLEEAVQQPGVQPSTDAAADREQLEEKNSDTSGGGSSINAEILSWSAATVGSVGFGLDVRRGELVALIGCVRCIHARAACDYVPHMFESGCLDAGLWGVASLRCWRRCLGSWRQCRGP